MSGKTDAVFEREVAAVVARVDAGELTHAEAESLLQEMHREHESTWRERAEAEAESLYRQIAPHYYIVKDDTPPNEMPASGVITPSMFKRLLEQHTPYDWDVRLNWATKKLDCMPYKRGSRERLVEVHDPETGTVRLATLAQPVTFSVRETDKT